MVWFSFLKLESIPSLSPVMYAAYKIVCAHARESNGVVTPTRPLSGI